VDYSLADLLAFARRTACSDSPDAAAGAGHHPASALLALALRALNGSEVENGVADLIPRMPHPSEHSKAMHEAVGLPELEQELRLVEKETGIAPDPKAPIIGYVRAVAITGNARAQRLLARLKAALIPPV
jgi:hypothetical protein